MKKFIALFGSVALLSACTFTVTTDMDNDQEDDIVPAEETVEEGTAPAEDTAPVEEEEPAEEAPVEEAPVEEAPVEEEAPVVDEGTVNDGTVEDAGGDGSDTGTEEGEVPSSEAAAE